MACVPTVPTTIVSPSGAALATESAPLLPPAPGLLSISTGWFQATLSFSPIRRARMSGAPPGVKVTTMCIGLPAFAPCECAGGTAASSAASRSEQAIRTSVAVIARAFRGSSEADDYSACAASSGGGFSQSRHHRRSQENEP